MEYSQPAFLKLIFHTTMKNEIEEFTVDLQVQWWEAADNSNTASSQVV